MRQQHVQSDPSKALSQFLAIICVGTPELELTSLESHGQAIPTLQNLSASDLHFCNFPRSSWPIWGTGQNYSKEAVKLSPENNDSLVISFMTCTGLGGKGKGKVDIGAGE